MERLVDDMAHSVATNVDALLRETAVPPEKSKSTTTLISHGYSDMTYLSPTKLSQRVALPHTDDGHVDGQEEQRLQVNPNADITSTHIPPNPDQCVVMLHVTARGCREEFNVTSSVVTLIVKK